jgi:hypothetical protein
LYNQLNEFKEDANKQLTELKENSNTQMNDIKKIMQNTKGIQCRDRNPKENQIETLEIKKLNIPNKNLY